MAKGIKKIKWTGVGNVIAKLSVPNQKITIEADQFTYFNVDSWFEDTPESDKTKQRFWTLHAHNKKDVLLEQVLTAEQNYGLRIQKKFCGPYTYYLQANLSKERDFISTGLFVSGHCEPKITSTKWCTSNDGEDVRSSHTFSYGHRIFLTMNTEGLNGYKNLELFIYRKVGDAKMDDDMEVAHFAKVEVTNGEIDLEINNSSFWYGKLMMKGIKPVEQFYVKVKDPATGKYILNDKKETAHAEFLKIQNKTEQQHPEPPKNLTPMKVGEVEASFKKYQLCKFSKVVIKCKEEKDAVIFNEGKFIKKINSNDNSIIAERIFYDYDQWHIRADAKPILNEIAKYLIEPPCMPVVLGSHTDCRGTSEYNLDLSLKRAQSAVDYLVQQGVDKNLITAKGFGETKLINHGEDISEALHQENRRTSLRFNVFGNNGQTLLHPVIVPSYKLPRQTKIEIDDFSRDCCFKKGEHKNEIIVIDNYKKKKAYPLKPQKEGEKIKNSVSHAVYSFTPSIPELWNSFMSDETNLFHFYLNSCAYYSKVGEKHPTFAIKAYPDVNWVTTLRYNYFDDPKDISALYFKQIPVKLVVGIEMIRQIEKAVTEIIKGIAFLSEDLAKNAKTITEYITEMPKKFGVGMHALHDFSDPKTPTQRIDYTQKYKWVAEIYIAELCLGIIAVDLLILWFTKGKGSFARIRKYRKVLNAKKKFDDMGFEFIEPKIAYSQGLYFEKQPDGRVAQVNQMHVKANPLIGVKYDKEHKLHELAQKGKGLAELIKEYGIEATLSLKINGTIEADYIMKYNSLIKTISIKDTLNSHLSNDKGIFTGGTAIAVNAEIDIKGKVDKNIQIIPFIPPTNIKVDASFKAKLGGYIKLTRQYGIVKGQMFHQDIINFSGVSGTYKLRIKTKVDDYELDSNPEEKVVPFVLFEKHTMKFGKSVSFNI